MKPPNVLLRCAVALVALALAGTPLGGCSSCGDKNDASGAGGSGVDGTTPAAEFNVSWDGGRRHHRLRPDHGGDRRAPRGTGDAGGLADASSSD